jgi:cytohesin
MCDNVRTKTHATHLTNDQGWTALHAAAELGHIDIAEYLVAHGANINAEDDYGLTPLHLAAYDKNKAMVEYLIENGANVNARGNIGRTPLFDAGSAEIVEFLIAHGADVNAKDNALGLSSGGRTALFDVDDKDIAECLINHGADVNVKDNDGITPLQDAISKGAKYPKHKEVAEVLKAHGASE